MEVREEGLWWRGGVGETAVQPEGVLIPKVLEQNLLNDQIRLKNKSHGDCKSSPSTKSSQERGLEGLGRSREVGLQRPDLPLSHCVFG